MHNAFRNITRVSKYVGSWVQSYLFFMGSYHIGIIYFGGSRYVKVILSCLFSFHVSLLCNEWHLLGNKEI